MTTKLASAVYALSLVFFGSAGTVHTAFAQAQSVRHRRQSIRRSHGLFGITTETDLGNNVLADPASTADADGCPADTNRTRTSNAASGAHLRAPMMMPFACSITARDSNATWRSVAS